MITTRFAPAPTGWLHLGHVVNAIYVWGLRDAASGRVHLRIEDHDRVRSRPEFERGILDDLERLGFVPDEPSFDEFRAGASTGRQSDREAVYRRALDRLIARGLVYACDCSRAAILASSSASGGELRYPGTCAHKNLPLDGPVGLRVRVEDRDERFSDLRHGAIAQNPFQQCGDLLIRDRDRNWTYQFAVAVDDFEQGISHVVRGDDLLASTGRQIQLARMLGRERQAVFLHHPLIMKSPTQKLSKADADTSLRDLRAAGKGPADVIGHAAWLSGLLEASRPLPRAAAGELVGHLLTADSASGSLLA